MIARLGLGLIGIGRPWPGPDRPIPSAAAVQGLLEHALISGIQFFDTAPAYGSSEQRLGNFLRHLTGAQRAELTIATKCGEYLDSATGSAVDHHPDRLVESVERSIEFLGRIDLLQLHQASTDVLSRPEVLDTLERLRQRHSIDALGVSAKDTATCEAALKTRMFSHIQMPVNSSRPDLADWARRHHDAITIIGNRPLLSGAAVGDIAAALAYAADAVGPGVVITGTTRAQHLDETLAAWRGGLQD